MKKYLFTVCLFVLAAVSGFSQNLTKQCTPGGFYYSCGAAAAHQSEQGPWFPIIVNNNWNSWYEGYGVTSASWKEYDNGTAKLTARLYQIIDKDWVKFDLDITFSSKSTTGTPHGADNWHCIPNNTSDWYYYKVASGTLTGVTGSKVQGAKFNISNKNGTSLQIGTGGSINSNSKYGMSAWLSFQQVGWAQNGNNVWLNGDGGDIYFDLNNCTTPTPTVTCSELTSGGQIGSDQSGCAPYAAASIKNVTLPSGGDASKAIEYVWLKTTDANGPANRPTCDASGNTNLKSWSLIAGATGHEYNPGSVSQTTWYLRCARRVGCPCYYGESNLVKITITGNCGGGGGTCPNLVVNGGFAQGYTGFTSEIRKNTWADCYNGGSINVVSNSSEWGFGACGDKDGNGKFLLIDFPSGDVWQKIWTQTVNVQPNTNYTFSFWANSANSANPAQLYAMINTQVFPAKTLPTTTCQWVQYQVSWNSGNSTTANLMIKNNVAECHGNDFAIDDISLTCNGGGTTPGTCAAAVTASNNGPKCIGQNVQLSANGTSTSTGTGGGTSLGNNLAVNGNFDAGNTGFTSELNHNCNEGCDNYNVNSNMNTCFHWAPNCGDHTGNGGKMLIFDSPGGDAWKVYWRQCINVQPNTTYEFSYWATSLFNGSPARLYSVINNTNTGNVSRVVTLGTTTCQWQKITVTWNSGSATQACIMLKNENGDCSGNDFAIDDISFKPIVISTPTTCTPSYAWTGPNGFTSSQQNPTVTTAGTYTVTYKDQFCCTATASTNVSFSDAPNAAITGTLQVCAGATTTLTATGGNTYLWSNGATTSSITVAAGTYTVVVSNGAGCSATANATVVETANPRASITGNLTVCAGQNTTLTANSTGSVLWSNGSTAQTISVGAGTYNVEITSAAGCKATASATVTSTNLTTAITGGTTVCVGKTTTLTASGGGTYLWSNGATTSSITVGAGTYSVVVTSASGCTATASATVTETANPTVNITGALTTCNGGTTTLIANATGTYVWSNGATTQSITVGAGTYTVVVSNGSGCSATASATVTTGNLTTAITGGTTVCVGKTTTLIASGGGTYAWSNGATTSSITVGAGNYTVIVTGASGCTATASATVTETANPTVNITGTLTTCNGGTTTLTANATGTYLWSNGATTQSITVGAGTYTVVVSNGSGCSATASATVTTGNSTTAITGGTTVCVGKTTTLTASGGGTYAWSNGATTSSITVGAGTYTVVVTSASGCTATASATVTETANPTVNITGALTTCNGGTTTLTANATGTYLWSNGATTQSITVGAGTYTVVASNGSGCSATASATVTNGAATVDITGEPTVCQNATTTLTASAATSYIWSNGATTASINVGAGTYTVTATTANGCSATKSITVTTKDCNTSSVGDFVFCDKNGNGIQDANEPGIAGVTVTLTGTDTNGQPVTRTTTTDANGKYNFTNLPAGTYSVKFNTPNGFTTTAPNKGGNNATDSDANLTTGSSATFTLTQGQNNNTIDAGYYQLGSIGNFVFCDKDNNGVQDAGEPGIAGVTVTLTGTAGDGTPVTLTTTTDNNGAYIFANLKPGTYTVNFGKPTGFTSSPKDAGANDATDSDADANGNVPVTLTSGQNNDTIDAGFNKPTATNASIGDFVFCDKNGNGVQDAGEPGIAGVTVTLTGTNASGQPVTLTTTTDANGKYNFPNLQAGTYKVTFTKPAGYTGTGADKGGNDATDSDANPTTGMTANIILAASENNATVDAGFYQGASLGNFVFCDKNQDGKQDAGDTGIAGVTVTLTGVTGDGTNVTLTTTTDANGAYNFANLAPGMYAVSFTKPTGFASSPQDQGDDTKDSDANVNGNTAQVALTSGQNNNTIDAGFYQSPNAKLGDKVFCDKNGNGIQDAGEPGVAGVQVVLMGTSATGQFITQTLTTDANGNYLFENLPAGTYKVLVSLPTDYRFTGMDKGGNDATDSDVDANTGETTTYTLTNGQSNLTVDAGIYKLSAIGDKVFCDKNQDGKQDAGEPGLADVKVTLTGTAGDGTPVTLMFFTDANGNYKFNSLKPGTYVVAFEKPTTYTASPQDQGDDTLDSDANPTTGATAPIILPSGTNNMTVDAGFFIGANASLGDLVFCDKNGNGSQDAGEPGIAGVTVTLTGTNASGQPVTLTATTDVNGKYLFANLQAGTYKVTFAKPAGYVATGTDKGGNDATDSDADMTTGMTINYTLATGQANLTVDAGFYQLSSIGDFVFDDKDNNGVQGAGEPGLAGVTVTLTGTSGDGLPVTLTTTTSPTGAYSFTGLKPGTYTLTFGKPSGYNASPKNQGGNPATDSDIDTNGSVTITLPSGTNNTTIDAGFNKPVSANASIGDLVFCDKNGNGVQDAGEPGLAGITVTLTGTNASGQPVTLTTVTDANGKYNFPNLQAGTYKVTVTKPVGYFATGQDKGGNDATDSDIDAATCMTANITLAAGQTNTTVDAGLLQYSSIGDCVFKDANNNGIQDGGELGFAGVTVVLNGLVNNVPITQVTTTDANGKYKFINLLPGSYTVTFQKPTGFVASPQDQGNDDTLDSDANPTTGATATINLTSGQTITNIDAGFGLPVANNITIGDFVFLDCNKDDVQTGDAGIANVTVKLKNAAGTVVATTTTNVSGKYSFSVPAGAYNVCFAFPANTTGLTFVAKDKGTNDAIDSDVNSAGETGLINFTATNNTIDAGISDVIAPVLSAIPANVTVACSAVPPVPSNVTATDNFDKAPVIMFSSTNTPLTAPGQYLLKRTWTAVDKCGNKSTKTWIICVKDEVAPVISNFPKDVTVECNAIPAVANPTILDNCDNNVSVDYVQTIIPGSCPDSYKIKRSWSAKDNAGNICVHVQYICVQDTKAPVITGVPADVTVKCGNPIPFPPAPGAVKGTDNCDAYVTLTFSEVYYAGSCNGKGLIKCQWTATDNCGNIAIKIWTITLESGAISLVKNTQNNPTVITPIAINRELIETAKVLYAPENINVFPNPTYGEVTVNLGVVEASKLTVINEVGQVIQTIANPANVLSLDLSNNRKGFYTVQVFTTQGILTKKLILIE